MQLKIFKTHKLASTKQTPIYAYQKIGNRGCRIYVCPICKHESLQQSKQCLKCGQLLKYIY